MTVKTKFMAIMIAVLVLPSFIYALPAEAQVSYTPTLTAPANNQVLTNFPRVATFNWSQVANATGYQLEIACDTCVSKTNLYANTKSYDVGSNWYSVNVPGADNTFRWRVRAKFGNSFGTWSSYRYFKYNTSGTSNDQPIILPAPSVSQPLASQVLNSKNVNFSWSAISGAVQYRFTLTKPGLAPVIYQTNISQNYINYTVAENASYTMQVCTINNQNQLGQCSSRNFTVNEVLIINKPTINQPFEGQVIADSMMRLSWSSVSGYNRYQYILEKLNKQNNVWQTIRNDYANNNWVDVNNDYNADHYRFRVKVDAVNDTGMWSDWRYFSSSVAEVINLGIPVLVYPVNQSTIYQNSNFNLHWNGVPNSTAYEYQLTRQVNGSWVMIDSGTVTSNYKSAVLPFEGYGLYSFRVRAVRNNTYGDWSGYSQFYYYSAGSNQNNNITPPVIASPFNGQNYYTKSVNINWSVVNGATAYEVNVQYESNNNWFNEGSYLSNNNYYTKYFNDDNNYKLRVRAKFADGNFGNWSDWINFTVGNSNNVNYSVVPSIITPTENQVFSGRNVSIAWSNVVIADRYQINIQYESNGVWYEEGSYLVNNANYDKYFNDLNEYRVRVRARYSNGTYGDWSGWRNFVIGDQQNYVATKPNILAPTQNAVVENSTRQATLSWTGVYTATNYEIEMVSDGRNNTQTIYPGSATSYVFNMTADSGWYHFRVRAKLSNGSYTAWSDWRYFQYFYTLAGDYLSPPIITSPAVNQVFNYSNINFFWTGVSGANGYDIEYAYASSGSWITDPLIAVTINNYSRNHESGNDYRVRVRAKFADGSRTRWSEAVTYTIR